LLPKLNKECANEVPDQPTKTDEDDVEVSWAEDDSSERPTVAPPFDLETYAKAATAPSGEIVLELEKAARTPLEQRIDQALLEGKESRTASDTASTRPPPRPPPLVPDLVPDLGAGATTEPPEGRVTPHGMHTPSGMQRLEDARALSAQDEPAPDDPRPRLVPGTLLSLANMQVPSNLPPRPISDAPVVTLVGMEEVPDSSPEIEVDPQSEMKERFALGDYSGALVVAESLLEENPTHVEAREYAESCRSVLQQMYMARIGSLDRVPIVAVARDQLRWLSIDHRAGFVLSLVDGISSLEMILDVSGMASLDALRILFELVEQRIISLRDD
jgi:hypothetical protein